MSNTDITPVVTQLAQALGFDLSQVSEIVINPHQVIVSGVYVNGAGKVVEHTAYHPITITLPEDK